MPKTAPDGKMPPKQEAATPMRDFPVKLRTAGVAVLLGVGHQAADRIMFERGKRKDEDNFYDLAAVVDVIHDALMEAKNARKELGRTPLSPREKVDLERAKREAIENKKREGELEVTEDVASIYSAVFVHVKSALHNITRDKLAEIDAPAKTRRAIGLAVDEWLNNLADECEEIIAKKRVELYGKGNE